MIKKTLCVGFLLLLATNVYSAYTAPPLNISESRHNFSSIQPTLTFPNTYFSTNEDEVCIFCHTPHGGTLNTPLWNRELPTATGFTHYTSETLSPYMKTTLSGTRVVNTESLLCMSCHDGAVALNVLVNNSNRNVSMPTLPLLPGAPLGAGVEDPINNMWGLGVGAVIGDAPGGAAETKNLTDDHPISFSYNLAVADGTNAGKLYAADDLEPTDPRKNGIRFFGATNRVECSSCHDPHVNYEGSGGAAAFTPFLVTSNAGSALCLSCHIK